MVGEDDVKLRRTVVLVGLMGAGKSAVGRRLAQRLALPFVDVDTEIERAAGATIAEIWARDGEAVFRAAEQRIVGRLFDGPVGVMAAGGGSFMNPEIRERIRRQGVSVWLKADLETLLQRTAKRNTRPLLNTGDPRATLENLIETRTPIYAEADLVVDSQPGSPDLTVQMVIDALWRIADRSGYVGLPVAAGS